LPSRSIWPVIRSCQCIVTWRSKLGTSPIQSIWDDVWEQLTETGPLAELLAVGNLDERDPVLAAQGDDQLLVGLLLARLIQDAHVGLAAVKGLGCLAETTGEAVVDEGDLEDTLQGVEDGHAAALAGRIVGGDLDLLGGRDLFGVGGLFSVRLGGMLSVWNSIDRRRGGGGRAMRAASWSRAALVLSPCAGRPVRNLDARRSVLDREGSTHHLERWDCRYFRLSDFLKESVGAMAGK
jgi:hypothetical protein